MRFERMGMSHTKWDHSIYIAVISMEKGIHFNENKQKKMAPKKLTILLWPPEVRCALKWCVGCPVTATYHDLESVIPAHGGLQSLGNAQGLQSNLEILRISVGQFSPHACRYKVRPSSEKIEKKLKSKRWIYGFQVELQVVSRGRSDK